MQRIVRRAAQGAAIAALMVILCYESGAVIQTMPIVNAHVEIGLSIMARVLGHVQSQCTVTYILMTVSSSWADNKLHMHGTATLLLNQTCELHSGPPLSQQRVIQLLMRYWETNPVPLLQAVCFDVDCTCTVNDGLDLLAEFMGVGSSVASITTSAMDGTMALEDALEERLRIINCNPQVC